MSSGTLIDTHFLIWLRTDPNRVVETDRLLLDSASLRYISVVSLWEIGILASRDRVNRTLNWFELPPGFEMLSIRPEHCRVVASLPFHHRDPFDRMLIAQARAEGVGILTQDDEILRYGRMRDGLLIPD